MIVTLTPNPSIDRTVMLSTLILGGVNRALAVRQDPGGKGVNVSRAAVAHGEPTVAVLPLGGAEGTALRTLLTAAEVPVQSYLIDGSTRLNTTLAHDNGSTTKINEPGPTLGALEADELVTACAASAKEGDWVLGAGSLPPGMPDDFYVRLVEAAHAVGARCAVDSSGVPFFRVLDHGVDLVKPNHHELGEVFGRELSTIGDIVKAARELNVRGITTVIVSLGGSGAVAVTQESVVHAVAPRVLPVSTVGAGDALLAGYLIARSRGADLTTALASGVRFGTAAVRLEGSLMPTPHDIADVDVTLRPPNLDEAVDE